VYLGEQTSFEAENMYTVTAVKAPTSTSTETPGFYITPRAQVSLPHGSALYKSSTYNLWDANKVSGCVCDAGFYGHDCSLRKCPAGHDPLDVLGEDKVDTKSSTSTTNPSIYTKRNERQMLTIDSTHGAVSGTFKLVFTDSRGVKHTTTTISTSPLLTSTVRVGSPNAIDDTFCKEANKNNMAKDHTADGFSGCYKVVYFTPDLPEAELAVGDHIRVGQDIRYVAALTRNSVSGGYSSATVSSQFSSTFASGSYAYRHSAASAIKGALEGLSGNACGAVSVDRSMSSGTLLFAPDASVAAAGVVSAENDNSGAVTDLSTSKITATLHRESLHVGDIVRLHSNAGQMQVTSLEVTSGTGAIGSVKGSPRAFSSSADNGVVASDNNNVVIRENGFAYKVSFDGTSGDVADLVCDSSNLRPVYRLSRSGYVSRDEPDRIYFVDTMQGSSQPAYKELTTKDRSHPEAVSAGDVVYIGQQRCEVVNSDDHATASFANPLLVNTYQANSIVCKDPLKVNAHSTADAIYTHESLEVYLGQETVSCSSTDTPHLRFVRRSVTASNDADCNNGEGCADVYDYNGEKRMVTHAVVTTQPSNNAKQENTLLDLSDLAVGDRVMLDTKGHTQEIRTVDSINIALPTAAAANNYFTVSQPFSTGHSNVDMYLYWKGSTGSSTCSGRGICDEGTGDCQCFRGYTGQACEVQNALAA
jgi:hypothetical protein